MASWRKEKRRIIFNGFIPCLFVIGNFFKNGTTAAAEGSSDRVESCMVDDDEEEEVMGAKRTLNRFICILIPFRFLCRR